MSLAIAHYSLFYVLTVKQVLMVLASFYGNF